MKRKISPWRYRHRLEPIPIWIGVGLALPSRAFQVMSWRLIWHAVHAICASGLALELKWNVLYSAYVLPCLRGARLAETKDRFDWGLSGLTQVPALNTLEVVSGKPLEPFNSTLGETRVQVPVGFWLPRSA